MSTDIPRSAGAAGFGSSPLDAVEAAFRLLVCEPSPLALDGAVIGHGLPARPIPLAELRVMLLHPSLGYAARESAWRELVRRARTDNGWLVGAVGVALPGLRRLAGRLARDFDGDTADLDAEMLAAFVDAVRSIDLGPERIPARLCYAAYAAGRRLRRREAAHSGRRAELREAVAPPPPCGHPDLVLQRAVAAGVITHGEAELIGETRLGGLPLAQAAAEAGLSYQAAWQRRRRAEVRLVAFLRGSGPEESRGARC